MQNKKSQFELFGLVIIVLLVIIGFFIALKFALAPNKEAITLSTNLKTSKLANNLITSMLETDTTCDVKIRELLADCVAYGSSSTINCQGKNSCDYVITPIKTILQQSLEIPNQPYYFTVYQGSPSNSIITPITFGNCNIGDVGESKFFPIPSDAGTFMVQIHLCQS